MIPTGCCPSSRVEHFMCPDRCETRGPYAVPLSRLGASGVRRRNSPTQHPPPCLELRSGSPLVYRTNNMSKQQGEEHAVVFLRYSIRTQSLSSILMLQVSPSLPPLPHLHAQMLRPEEALLSSALMLRPLDTALASSDLSTSLPSL